MNGTFSDLTTDTLYYDVFKMPWDLQRTTFAYMDAVDQLTGSSLKKMFLKAHDENGDGVVTYEEFGKKGAYGPLLFAELTDEEKRRILGLNAMEIMERVNPNYRKWKEKK